MTAQTGAVIQDICNVTHRRNPYVQIRLYPAKVQGEGAAQTVIRGIRYFEKTDVDTIIIGRGGGSIEVCGRSMKRNWFEWWLRVQNRSFQQ